MKAQPAAAKPAWTIKETFPVWSGTVVTAGDDVTLNGADAQAAMVRGIVYVPTGSAASDGKTSTPVCGHSQEMPT